jgi:hypothetical protein
MHTAVLLASQLIGVEDRKCYSAIGVFDMRHLCPEQLRHRVAAYHMVWPVNVVLGDFDTTAKCIKTFYTTFPGRQNATGRTSRYQSILAGIKSAFSQPPPATPSTVVGLSSVGKIDDRMTWQYETLRVQDFWLTQDVMTPNVLCTFWTREESMRIMASYNDEYYSLDAVDAALTMICKLLLEGLGIDC